MRHAQHDRPQVDLLVTDLDNTLWDWFAAWFASFSAMLTRLSELSGIEVGQLEKEIRSVHQLRGTTEYSYLLNELPSLQRAAGGVEPLLKFDDAMHVLNSQRLRSTRLYPGVRRTLAAIRAAAVPIVAYSESLSYWTEWRIRKTNLDGAIDVLYTSPDHDFPNGVSPSDLRTQPNAEYGLRATLHRQVPRGTLKPSALVLQQILDDFQVDPERVVYIGDSVMKDIVMAKSVGVRDVLASYGAVQMKPNYDLLRRVSHWTDADVERERKLLVNSLVAPTYEAKIGFHEIMELFEFGKA